jgi:multidrug efflux pump subunit AcrA (membrane-fusion protein)
MAVGSATSARRWPLWGLTAAIVILGFAAWITRERWQSATGAASTEDAADGEHSDEADHPAQGAIESRSVTLSERGLKNIGFRPTTISLGTFVRTVTVPAIISEKPGQTQVHLTSPVGGVLQEIYVVQGEAISPGSQMFQVRVTHEDVVAAQQEYLETVESLDVVDREIARLQSLGEGVIAGKRILEQQYEKQKLEGSLRAAEQALLLHGLTTEQVTGIRDQRQLLQTLTIFAPEHSHAGDGCQMEHTFHVQKLPVSVGQQVEINQELAVLADHCELYVQGRAFEDDARWLRQAVQNGWTISATLISKEQEEKPIQDLKLLYLADTIDPESRAFTFYLRLPNEIVLDQTSDGNRFIEWRYKPGQRLELKIPRERWDNRIVLPIDAIVDEGAETFVYRQNGDSFEQVPVHVEYRDAHSAVVVNDGAVFPGDVVAGHGAYQMHLALKNQAGGGVDPHAGHNH